MAKTDLKMLKKLIIVADDFTGANDTGVQFRNSGLRVNVIINYGNLEEEADLCDVLVIDLESRQDTSETAFKKSFNLGKQIHALGNAQVYKKLDSGLRGNIGAELDGLMAGLNINVTFLAPAYPMCGRTTENGNVIIKGIKLADTEYRNDPHNPINDSRISSIIASQCSRKWEELPSGFSSDSHDTCYTYLENKINKGAAIFIFDCKTEQEMSAIARLAEGYNGLPFLAAGSAGLARHLDYFSLLKRSAICFVFSGSVTETTLSQIAFAEREENCMTILLDAISLIDNKIDSEGIYLSVNKAITGGTRRFIFCTARSQDDVESVNRITQQRSLKTSQIALLIAGSMGMFAAAVIERFNPRGVLVTGGETAYRTVDALKATGLTVDTEILPGMQCGRLRNYNGDTQFATKSGGFGGEDAFSRFFEFFKC